MAHGYIEVPIHTEAREVLLDITRQVSEALERTREANGMVWVYSPHTTAGITIQENADPDVRTDIIAHLKELIPQKASFRHREGNSDAHLKTAFCGASQAIPFADGQLLLGTWQAIYFCEFDGPRKRRVLVKVLAG